MYTDSDSNHRTITSVKQVRYKSDSEEVLGIKYDNSPMKFRRTNTYNESTYDNSDIEKTFLPQDEVCLETGSFINARIKNIRASACSS